MIFRINKNSCILNKIFNIFHIAVLFIIAALINTQRADAAVDGKLIHRQSTHAEQAQAIVNILDRCPAWTHIDNSDKPKFIADKQKILRSMKAIAVYDTDVIEQAERTFTSHKGSDLDTDSRLMTVYLLHRYLFDVDVLVNFRVLPFFKLYFYPGMPRTSVLADNLWPLGWDQNGHLTVVGYNTFFLGSTGSPLDGSLVIDEFEYFKSHYKRRTTF